MYCILVWPLGNSFGVLQNHLCQINISLDKPYTAPIVQLNS